MLDVRNEADHELFDLVDSTLVAPSRLDDQRMTSLLADAIKVVMSNGEMPANEVAKDLMARGVRKVYILAGRITGWLDTYSSGTAWRIASSNPDALCYQFPAALGAHYAASNPNRWTTPQVAFIPKVKFDRPIIKVKGGCGG